MKKRMRGCWTVKDERLGKALVAWRKCAECGGKTLEIEELRKLEEALPRLKEGGMGKVSRLYEAKTGVGCDGFHPKVPLDVTKKREEKSSSSWRRWSRVDNNRNKHARRCSS